MRTLAVLVLAAFFQGLPPAVPVDPTDAILEKFKSYAVVEKQVDAVLNLGVFAPGHIPREYCDDPDYVKMRLFRMDLRGGGDRLRAFCGLLK